MDKVFLVDDEEWIIENLKISVNWAKYGYEIAGTANNGLDAYKKIREIEPQLVFTDIRMAGMSGLELIKKVNENLKDVKFVVISGFAEFAYAQKAINNGALGYLLKPIDDNEIIRLLAKINEEKKESEAEDHFYETLLLSGEYGDRERSGINDKLRAAGLDMSKSTGIRVVVSVGQEKFNFSAIPHKIIFQTGVNRTAYLLHDSTIVPPANILPNPLPNWVCGVGIGNVFYQEDQILDCIDETTVAAFHYFIDPLSKTNSYNRVVGNNNIADEFFQSVQKQLNEENISELASVLHRSLDLFKKSDMNIVHAFHLHNMLYFYLQNKMEYNPVSQITSFERLVLRYGNVVRLIESLIGALQKMKSHNGAEAYPAILKNETAGAIIKYINLNFANDISLTDISEQFNINPGYISQLLKKEIGKNYLEYLTKLRIENACKLLKTTNLNVNQIAEKSGYDDFLYFRKIFKKSTGHTPSEYREAYRK